MQLNRVALIASIDRAITADEKANKDWWEAKANFIQEHRRAWIENEGQQLLGWIPKLRLRVRSGKPVRAADLPTTLYSPPQSYQVRDAIGQEPVSHLGYLRGLRAALAAIEDETLTHTAMASIGYRDLTKLFDEIAKHNEETN